MKLAILYLLVAAKCSPSIVNELRDCRAATGEIAKFEIQFAGNPKPGTVCAAFRAPYNMEKAK